MAKTPQEVFIESLLARQDEKLKEAKEKGYTISKIRKEDLVGLVFVDGELVFISSKDVEKYDI